MRLGVISRVAGLGALTAAGQLVVIGTLPLYSRLFDPAAYGIYVVFVGACAVTSVLAGVRYDSAIVLPRRPALAGALSGLVVTIGFAVSVLIGVLTLLVAKLGLGPERWAVAGPEFGYGLATATAIGAVQRCLISWCVRRARFLLMGAAQFVFALGTVAAQLTLARVQEPLGALVWGYVLAFAAQTVCLAAVLRTDRAAFAPGSFAPRAMALAARKYRRFPTYMVGYALASSVRDRLIQGALGIGAGAAAVGRFGLAYRVMFAPNSLVYSAVSPIFYSIASRGRREHVGRFAAGLVEATFAGLVGPYVAFAVEAPAFADVTLAEKWHGTGPFLQALAFPALMLAATCWIDRAFDAFRQQRTAFALEAGFTLISVSCVAATSRLLDPIWVTRLYAALALVYYWLYWHRCFRACAFPMADYRHACTSVILSLAVALAACILVHSQFASWLRLPLYLLAASLPLLAWVLLRGGADILRMLARARIGDDLR